MNDETAFTIRDFTDTYGMAFISRRWMLEKDVSDFLHLNVTGGIILADVLTGDGMRDHISPELLSGFQSLMGDKADTADKIRDILVEKLMLGDASVQGMVNKIKGQVGENVFKETAMQSGFDARLADLGNQEAWDVAVTSQDGVTRYIQVKTMASPDQVIVQMQSVAEKVASGHILDGDIVVEEISFAVPSNIYDEVVQKSSEAGLNTNILPFDLSAQNAGKIVQDGFDNVAHWGLGNFFDQLAGGMLTALTIHTLVQMYLLYKGASQADSLMRDILSETGYSAGGIGAALGMESITSQGLGMATGSLPAVAILVMTGLTARGILRRIVARHDYAGFLAQENIILQQRIASWENVS